MTTALQKINHRFPSSIGDKRSSIYSEEGESLDAFIKRAYQYYELGDFDTFTILDSGVIQTETYHANGSNLDKSLYYLGEVSY